MTPAARDDAAEAAPADAGDAPAASSDEQMSSDAVSSDERVEELSTELEELNAQYARAVADYQNLRRRADESRREQARHTLAAIVINYLPVLDDLQRALDAVSEHQEIADHQWVDGVRMVERKFRGVLEAGGVSVIEAEGQAFDPTRHEAISYAPGPQDQVILEAQRGYILGDFVIRPAKVVVGNGESVPGGSAFDDTAPDGRAPDGRAPDGRATDGPTATTSQTQD